MKMEPIKMNGAITKRYVLLVTTLAAFLGPFNISSVNISLPAIGRELRMDAILLSWVTTAYLLTSAMFLVPFGKMADLYGRKKIFTYGNLIFILASIGSAFSFSAPMLIGFRILHGIGAAATYSIGAAMLTSAFPSKELGKVFGINLAAVYLGNSVGPFLGGFLTHHLSWRSIFLVNILLGLIILGFIFLTLKTEWMEARKEKFDILGSMIYSITLLLITYGFSQLSTIRGVWFILPGCLGLIAFVRWETKIENPILDINLFRKNKAFAFSNLAALINYSATFAIIFLLSLYLQYIKGLNAESAGFVMLSQPMVQAFFSPFAGRLSDKIEPRIVASIGMALITLGLFLFIFIHGETPLGFIVANLVLLGFGFALFSSPNTNAVMSSVENRYYGVASGTLGTMRTIGMVLSMGMTILIFSLYIGRVQITPEYYPPFLRGAKMIFTLFTVLCIGGTFASLIRGKVHHQP